VAQTLLGGPARSIQTVVAGLTKGGQVEQSGCLRAVIKDVGASQHDFASSDRVRHAILDATPLAKILGANEPDEPGAEFPVGRISGDHFWADWHFFNPQFQ
jgi:hypothetical protein